MVWDLPEGSRTRISWQGTPPLHPHLPCLFLPYSWSILLLVGTDYFFTRWLSILWWHTSPGKLTASRQTVPLSIFPHTVVHSFSFHFLSGELDMARWFSTWTSGADKFGYTHWPCYLLVVWFGASKFTSPGLNFFIYKITIVLGTLGRPREVTTIFTIQVSGKDKMRWFTEDAWHTVTFHTDMQSDGSCPSILTWVQFPTPASHLATQNLSFPGHKVDEEPLPG